MAAGIVLTVTGHGGGCGHRDVTVSLLGQQYVIKNADQLTLQDSPLDVDDLVRKLVRFLVIEKGVPLANIAGRVCLGEEATNVKVYNLITKDITKTNVGTNYVNVPIGANGERKFADFTGCTEFKPRVFANLIGVGPFGFRIVRDSDNLVLYENSSIALTGERELDPGWLPIPQGFNNETLLRLQIKSVTATDDPIVRGCELGVR